MKPKIKIVLIDKKAIVFVTEATRLATRLITILTVEAFVLWQCTLLFHILIF